MAEQQQEQAAVADLMAARSLSTSVGVRCLRSLAVIGKSPFVEAVSAFCPVIALPERPIRKGTGGDGFSFMDKIQLIVQFFAGRQKNRGRSVHFSGLQMRQGVADRAPAKLKRTPQKKIIDYFLLVYT